MSNSDVKVSGASMPSGSDVMPAPPSPTVGPTRGAARRGAVGGASKALPNTLAGWLVDGPDPVEAEEPVGILEVVLPWPIRCLVVGAATLAAWRWGDTGIGQQIAWGLQIGALVLVAIIASYWLPVLIFDSAVAALWLVPFRPPEGKRRRWSFLHAITFLNRQFGHIAALLVWTLVAFALSARLEWQLGAMTAVLLLGPPVLNGLAHNEWKFLGPDRPIKSTGELFWRRRVLIYLATVLGLAVLALSAPSQLVRIAPLMGSLSGGMILRTVRHQLRAHKVRDEQNLAGAGKASLDARTSFRLSQLRAARRADPMGIVLVLAAVVGLVAFSFWQRRKLDADLGSSLDGAPPPADVCSRDPDGPKTADIAVFLMADTQTHELSGRPFPGQTELAEAFVKSASRPVPLDMLSAIPVQQFASVYGRLRASRGQDGAPMMWAHLGDLADLSCKRELERIADDLGAFAKVGPLAGIAMGNHEMSFEGSFHWSPYWGTACSSGRLEKDDAAQQLVERFANALAPGGEFLRLPTSFVQPRGGSLTAVTPLGIVKQGTRQRGLIGVFLDTSDGRAFDNGMPGSVGAVSQHQLDAASAASARLRNGQGGPYNGDPAYVLFGHLPIGELAGASHGRVADFVAGLDARDGDLGAEPRVLAMVSAHTHSAGAHRHCIGNRVLREIVIGSTIDPPQQAALLEIGPDARGRLALALRTVQSVARPGATCGDASVATTAACRQVAARLRLAPACRTVLGAGPDDPPPRDCQDLERPLSFGDQLAALRTFRGPRQIEEKQRLRQLEAETLLACICRDGACDASKRPLTDDAYVDAVRKVSAQPERQQELVCLAWAASTCQAHKATGMTMGEALRCAFDDPSQPAERVSVATLEAATCY